MPEMRAVTVKQPWAWAIAHGGKAVENRSSGFSYRGLLAIHAGMTWSERGETDPRVYEAAHAQCVGRRNMPFGAFLAVAELVDVHPDAGCCRPWGESSYTEAGGRVRTAVHHLVLEDIRPLTDPLPCRGMLGLWRVPMDIAEKLLKEVAR
jgi:hypothetical protein